MFPAPISKLQNAFVIWHIRSSHRSMLIRQKLWATHLHLIQACSLPNLFNNLWKYLPWATTGLGNSLEKVPCWSCKSPSSHSFKKCLLGNRLKFEKWQERKPVHQKGMSANLCLHLHWLETGGHLENVSFWNEHGARQKKGLFYQTIILWTQPIRQPVYWEFMDVFSISLTESVWIEDDCLIFEIMCSITNAGIT